MVICGCALEAQIYKKPKTAKKEKISRYFWQKHLIKTEKNNAEQGKH